MTEIEGCEVSQGRVLGQEGWRDEDVVEEADGDCMRVVVSGALI